VGPLSGEPCAWYETTLTRSNHSSNRPDRHSDAGTTPAPPILTDATGWVSVDPKLLTDKWGHAQSDGGIRAPLEETTETYGRGDERPHWVTQGMASSLGLNDKLVMHEARLPHGREVFAMGRVVNGTLRAGRKALITKGGWADLIARVRDDIGLAGKMIPIFLAIGIVVSGGSFWILLEMTT
jgi:hypothetical protein